MWRVKKRKRREKSELIFVELISLFYFLCLQHGSTGRHYFFPLHLERHSTDHKSLTEQFAKTVWNGTGWLCRGRTEKAEACACSCGIRVLFLEELKLWLRGRILLGQGWGGRPFWEKDEHEWRLELWEHESKPEVRIAGWLDRVCQRELTKEERVGYERPWVLPPQKKMWT